MIMFWQGIILGLGMSLLIGPVVFLFLHTAIERGFRASAMAGFGVWVSDLFFVLSFYFGVSYVMKLVAWDGFKAWAGLLGGLILIAFGVATAVTPPPLPGEGQQKVITTRSSYFTLWFKGFLINTLNPFAAIFWLGVMSALSAKGPLQPVNAFYFFSGAIGAIVLTDILKIVLAKQLKSWLNRSHIVQLRRISAIAMVILGLALGIRGVWM